VTLVSGNVGATGLVVPEPGKAPMPAADAAALLRRNATDPAIARRPALAFDNETWTHAEYVAECARWANLILDHRQAGRPLHVAVLLDNIPEYLFALGGAALAGATVVGLNHTRRDEHLLRDLEHTDCVLLITEAVHAPLLDPIRARVRVPSLTVEDTLPAALKAASDRDPGIEPGPDTTWALIFTSGTSAAPKAVICSQRRILVTGARMGIVLGTAPDDIGYVCMPLFHSNAVMVGWAPSIVYGSSIGLARKFSASRWLEDVRRYRATYWSYTGKPLAYLLATPEQPDDADNTLRIAYGNEGSPQLVEEFARRYDVRVIDAFGATEGGVAVNRVDDAPAGALGLVGESVLVVDDDGKPLPRAKLDDGGRLLNAAECVGEIVNTAGAGPFEGYYNNDEANARALRNGWYWSGDLGYIDAAGFLYFAGRTADWIRVDGENFPAGPIQRALNRHPDCLTAVVYGVPDADAGDQVMACMVLREGASFDPSAFAAWLDAQADIGPKWRPRYVRITVDMPTTGSNKVLTRQLVHEKVRADRTSGDPIWVRNRGELHYRPFTAADETTLRAAFVAAGRERFWDL
jgi:fatty-acyl-CoA synthase